MSSLSEQKLHEINRPEQFPPVSETLEKKWAQEMSVTYEARFSPTTNTEAGGFASEECITLQETQVEICNAGEAGNLEKPDLIIALKTKPITPIKSFAQEQFVKAKNVINIIRHNGSPNTLGQDPITVEVGLLNGHPLIEQTNNIREIHPAELLTYDAEETLQKYNWWLKTIAHNQLNWIRVYGNDILYNLKWLDVLNVQIDATEADYYAIRGVGSILTAEGSKVEVKNFDKWLNSFPQSHEQEAVCMIIDDRANEVTRDKLARVVAENAVMETSEYKRLAKSHGKYEAAEMIYWAIERLDYESIYRTIALAGDVLRKYDGKGDEYIFENYVGKSVFELLDFSESAVVEEEVPVRV